MSPTLNRDPKTRTRHLTENEITIVAAYAKKHSNCAAQKQFNLSTTAVSRAMRLRGVKPKPNGKPPEYTKVERDAWIAYGRGVNKTAEHFGVATNTIRREFARRDPKSSRFPKYKKAPAPIVTPAMVALVKKVGPQQASNSTGISTYYLTKARDRTNPNSPSR